MTMTAQAVFADNFGQRRVPRAARTILNSTQNCAGTESRPRKLMCYVIEEPCQRLRGVLMITAAEQRGMFVRVLDGEREAALLQGRLVKFTRSRVTLDFDGKRYTFDGKGFVASIKPVKSRRRIRTH